MFRRLNSFSKDILIYSRLFYLIYPFRKFLQFLYNFSILTVWANSNRRKIEYNDFFRVTRKYTDRIKGFEKVLENFALQKDNPIVYLEFGVAGGTSFQWWQTNSLHAESSFFGFDTFEGLPENWGFFYKKSDMSYAMTEQQDPRSKFIKGLFQETLLPFIDQNLSLMKSARRKIIHLDADLFTATLFVLTQLFPYLKKGDILIFDEFSVANHEFFAFDLFQKSFYIKLKPLAAINNFYQLTFVVD
jgi:O-methyltransferase